MWGWTLTRTTESVVFMVFGFTWGIIVTIPALHWWSLRRMQRKSKVASPKSPR